MRIKSNSRPISIVLCSTVLLAIIYAYGAPNFCYGTVSSSSFQQKFNLPKDPDAVLKEILSRKEFTDAAKESLLDKFRTFLNKLWIKALSWLLDRLKWEPPSLGDGSIWAAIGILILSAILALILVKLSRFLILFSKIKPKSAEFNRDKHSSELGEIRAESIKLAAQGEYRKAITLLFRFVLLKLDELGRIQWHPCKTNREILRSVNKTTQTYDPLSEMISIFNGIYYGNKSCGAPEFQRFLNLAQAVTGE